jgi:hypothetical protein
MLELARQLERELIDIKGRLLPQFQGRADRAEKENADLRGQLAARSATAAMVSVPREPTKAMRNAGAIAIQHNGGEGVLDALVTDAVAAYKAMLSAAPVENKGTAAPVEEAATWQDQALAHLGAVRDSIDPYSVTAIQVFINGSRMKGEPERPDWAQQLPGAEIFDRSNDAGQPPK